VSFTNINLLLAASGLIRPCKCATAQSLTSTQPKETFGKAGILPKIKFSMISPDVKPAPTNAGPIIKPGLIVTSSNFSCSGSSFKKSQAAFSARVFDFT